MVLNAKKSAEWNIDELSKYVSGIIAKESGNILGENQQSMVSARLQKRLIDLNNMLPTAYVDYLNAHFEEECSILVSLLTTHHTFFFREFAHFEYIRDNLQSLVDQVKKRNDNKIRIYCAACSRGQETYSLAMFFKKHLEKFPGISFEIFSTDIDPESVNFARNGVYHFNEVKSIPQIYLQGNWEKGTGEISNFAKVKKELKEHCQFDVLNLLKIGSKIDNKKFDLIICRNVFIYFERDAILQTVEKFRNHLYKDGILITGLSESLKSYTIEKKTLAPSVYSFNMETDKVNEVKADEKTTPVIAKVKKSSIPLPMRILSVDDSSSVLKLLTKIFENDKDFQLVGTAKNGKEAEEFLKNNQVDAMTLDIHMPEMDGVEYLKKNFNKKHPKVVVLSSASREDARYAQKTIEYGAADFVEKPALNNLQQSAEEIKAKLKMAFLNDETHQDSLMGLAKKNNFKITNCENKLRVFFANFSDRKKIVHLVNELENEWPPLIIFLEGNGNFLDLVKDNLSGSKVKNIHIYNENDDLKPNNIYICDVKNHFEQISQKIKSKKKSVGILGACTSKTSQQILDWENMQLLLDDNAAINKDLKQVANDIFPWTSFCHLGTEYLAKDE